MWLKLDCFIFTLAAELRNTTDTIKTKAAVIGKMKSRLHSFWRDAVQEHQRYAVFSF